MIQPIYGERALAIGKTIVIADLHLGIEYEYEEKGIKVPVQTKNLLERVISILDKTKAERIIILGDLKHIIEKREYIMKERKQIGYFLKELNSHAEIWIVKGNHDGSIKSKYAKIYGARGLMLDDVALAHGHAWPSKNIMDASFFIMAHLHPNIRITTKTGFSYMEPCWVRGKFKKEFKEKYPEGNEKMEVVIMPAFNPIAGGIAINKEKLTHGIASLIDVENAYAYTLNGINLGRIRNLS